MTHIYAFGSICRGDLTEESDVDVLAVVSGRDSRFDPQKFSIYSYDRLQELWVMGNAFAWHLALESKLIFSDDGTDFILSMGFPSKYVSGKTDCWKFRVIFETSFEAITRGSPSLVFELSTIFLAIRNVATCFSLATMPQPTFGRDSARRLGPKSLRISEECYGLLVRSRLLSTRGAGEDIRNIDISNVAAELRNARSWINELCTEVARHG